MDPSFSSPPDGVLKIEARGIEPVPESARHGRPRDLALFWAGGLGNYATVLTASLLTAFFGLGVWDGLLAIALGTIAAATILGLLSTVTVRTGLPQVVSSARVFGPIGMKVAALLTLAMGVGWFAVDTVIAAQAGVQLAAGAGLGAGVGKLTFPLVLVVATVSVVVAVYGHATINLLERIGAVLFGAISLILFVALAGRFHWTAGPTVTGASYPGAFVLGFMVCFALVASWYPFAGDYSRYLPVRSGARSVTVWAVAGTTAIMLLLGLLGVLLPTVDPHLAAAPDGGVLAIVGRHAPRWVALPFFVLVIAGEIWANYLDVYTAGLCTQALGIAARRWQLALGCGVVGAVLAAYAVVVQDFHTAYEQFLLLSYLWAPGWAAITLLALFVLDRGAPARRRTLPAVVAWAFSTAVALAFVNYPATFPGVHAFNQPLIDALHGADLSGLVALAVGAGAYPLMRRVLR
jgi:NCS1 family nucleobase:cation symporter-1